MRRAARCDDRDIVDHRIERGEGDPLGDAAVDAIGLGAFDTRLDAAA